MTTGASTDDHTMTKSPRQVAMVRKGGNPLLPPNHPINALSPFRKGLIVTTLAYAGFLNIFLIGLILPAIKIMGESFGVDEGAVANTIGYMLLGNAVGPLFWNPLSRTVGRRPVYLAGSLISLPICVWLACSKTYVSFTVARVFAGLTLAFSLSVPPATVADIFVAEVRGQKMSIYGAACVVGPVVAPTFGSLIIHSTTWPTLFWFALGLCGLQFFMFLFFVPETMWHDDVPTGSTVSSTENHVVSEEHKHDSPEHVEGGHAHSEPLVTGHVGPAWMPWHRPGEYIRMCVSPIGMLRYVTILVPSFFYGIIFGWAVGLTIVTVQTLAGPPYKFAIIPLGVAFLAYMIGGILGLWSGGMVGDVWVARVERLKGSREPEDRLWALLPILPLNLVAMLIIGFVIQDKLHWIGLLIGGGLYYFTFTAATGIIATYVVEGYIEKSMDAMAVFNFWRMIWGFAVAFFAEQWGLKSGFLAEYAAQGAIVCGLGLLMCGVFIWKGQAIRMAQGMPVFVKVPGVGGH